jgi:hypothetical protein
MKKRAPVKDARFRVIRLLRAGGVRGRGLCDLSLDFF